MTTQHTPGPWYSNTKPDAAQGLIYEERTGKNIAVSYDAKDAPLISAAPELLDVVREFYEMRSTILNAGIGCEGVLYRARDAIAKATQP